MLWIALKFFVLLQSKQLSAVEVTSPMCCELLSNFLYFCSRNNFSILQQSQAHVVNCSQIFCTFAVETTSSQQPRGLPLLWIALKFFVLLQSKQLIKGDNDSEMSCELLSNFLYFCSRNNVISSLLFVVSVVNCSQIFCTFAVETTVFWLPAGVWCCELLSNFLYFCSRNNRSRVYPNRIMVVNCSQIFCTFAVETTTDQLRCRVTSLWIALKFFVLLQSKQPIPLEHNIKLRCELLSNFLYFCSRNNLCH